MRFTIKKSSIPIRYQQIYRIASINTVYINECKDIIAHLISISSYSRHAGYIINEKERIKIDQIKT